MSSDPTFFGSWEPIGRGELVLDDDVYPGWKYVVTGRLVDDPLPPRCDFPLILVTQVCGDPAADAPVWDLAMRLTRRKILDSPYRSAA